MKMSAEVNEVFTAFSAFQNEVTDVKRDTAALKHKYATLDQVLHVSRQLLASHGLGVTQLIGNCSGEYVEIETIILHKSGQFFSKKMMFAMGKIPLNSSGRESINMAQFVGLNISYARRYGLLAILGMTQEDNDAQLPDAVSNAQKKSYAQPNQQVQQGQYVNGYKEERQYAPDIDVRKLAVEQIISLIGKYEIPIEKVEKFKNHYGVGDIRDFTEQQAKSVINKIKTTFEVDNTKGVQ